MDGIEEQHLDQHLSTSAVHIQDPQLGVVNTDTTDNTDTALKGTARTTRAKQRQLGTVAQPDSNPPAVTATLQGPSGSRAPRRSVHFSLSGPSGGVDQSSVGPSGKGKKKVQIEEAEPVSGKRK